MREKFLDIGIDIGNKTGNYHIICPKCSKSRKKKSEKCLSINVEKGLYNCFHCGWSGNVNLRAKKEYVKPIVVKVDLGTKTINWFKRRGISETTLSNWKITESIEYFPQVKEKRTAINFNYYREKELVNIKFRDARKNFKLYKNAELIFYGIDRIKEMPKIYITEGEVDALSLFEAGVFSVCSVPNGASKGNQRLEYLDNCWEYFVDKKEIVLCTDNDQAGLSLRNELARRFGKGRCKYIDWGDYKDANEILVKQGKAQLREVLQDAKNFPIEGVLNINDIWKSVLNFNENGIKNYNVRLGDSREFYNISFGEWTVCTGIPNAGKSDVIDQICVNLALNENFRVAMFSPESFPYEAHIKRLANKINEKDCDTESLNNTKDFIIEHFDFVKIDLENLTLKGILDAFRQLVFQKGTNICVIDPWNMLDHSAQRDFTYVGKLLSEITQFCQQTNTHLFLVAHPRKMESVDGKYRVPTPYDISQSSDFFNKAYNCLTIYRNLRTKNSIFKRQCTSVCTKSEKKR